MRLSDTFSVFESRNYRLFFTGQLVSRIGTWMQRTAVIWVIYTMTHSVFLVGAATFAEQFPSFILSPSGGIVADRYDRYKVLMITQIVSALQAVVLTFVYSSGFQSYWVLLLLSAVLGLTNAYDVPVRQSMVNEMVDRDEDLPKAIAMNSSLNNLSRLLGPALSGIVLAKYGATVCFASNAISFIAVIFCLSQMKLRHTFVKKKPQNVWTDLREGVSYVRSQVQIRQTLVLLALLCFFVNSYNTLQPYFARDVFRGDASTFGYINGAIGLGALVSTLFLASQKGVGRLKRILFNNMILLGVGLVWMSWVHWLDLYLALAFMTGFGTMSIIPICNTIVQTQSSFEMRGRVVGFYAMAAFGMLPLGSLFVGWLSHMVGVENCLAGQGIFGILLALLFYRFLRKEPLPMN